MKSLKLCTPSTKKKTRVRRRSTPSSFGLRFLKRKWKLVTRTCCSRSAQPKSNQQNLGTIKSSNLCTEIVEFTSPEETAVCNLASIALPRFVIEKNESSPTGKTETKKLLGSLRAKLIAISITPKLSEITRKATRNLNRIIDVNYYPVETAKRSNMKHRPIGLGVQGLADVFILLGLPLDSPGG